MQSRTRTEQHPLQRVPGVGPKLITRLQHLGIFHPRDLLFHLPYRYQDRTRTTPIANLQVGEDALILGRVEDAQVQYFGRRSLSVAVGDGSGLVGLRFFHFSSAQVRGFQPQTWISCYGEVRRSRHHLELVHPEYRLYRDRPAQVTEDALRPIYPLTEGIALASMRKFVAWAMAEELDGLDEGLPDSILRRFDLLPIKDALRTLHYPPPGEALDANNHAAFSRLALEELLAHRLSLCQLRAQRKTAPAPILTRSSANWQKLKRNLGFSLTQAQARVVDEITADLSTRTPAMRLIHGDVGCGKTVVAAAAALSAIDADYQVALMAPTELLSEQHRDTFDNWFAPLGIAVEWLTGKMPSAVRTQSLQRLKSGAAKMVIGTHALFQSQVEFQRLGLLVVDEQHRFGVGQRLALRNKATHDTAASVPHQLIMSATPIPRSLAMIFYADLEVSKIDQLPPGRKPVQTVVLPNTRRAEIIARIRSIAQSKQQVYWVCPLIDESDKLQAEAATETYESLRQTLPSLHVALIHGRMKSAEKETVMRQFKDGEIHLLVATTVIEVGVDVPAASLMVIDNAERLGLAQLHQLRGRIGRGANRATCVLLYQPPLGANARQRLAILRQTNDGFAIAQKDLELRGPGEVLGTRQTGLQNMKAADLSRDRALLPAIEAIADELQTKHPAAVTSICDRWLSARRAYAQV